MTSVQDYLNKKSYIEEKEAHIDNLVQELYRESNRELTPKYPWILVRLLAKEQVLNGVILPATEQNKTLHEGIVLATWRPIEYELEMKRREYSEGTAAKVTYEPVPVKRYRRESQHKPGDHVVFHHWSGFPVDGFSEKRYRMVKEEGWKETQDGGICGVVEYDTKDTRPVEKLRKLLNEGNWERDELVNLINDQFLLVDRDGQSVTISGR